VGDNVVVGLIMIFVGILFGALAGLELVLLFKVTGGADVVVVVAVVSLVLLHGAAVCEI